MIPVYAANLTARTERKEHIISQFVDRPEFLLTIKPAMENEIGAVGLWNTICQVIKEIKDVANSEFLVFCEDDHQFTERYNQDMLHTYIEEARALDADILSGGVSWYKTGVQVSENLFWIEKFSGLQFTVIFRKFYNSILEASFSNQDTADYKISALTDKKFVIHPFISVQKEFGYSDVTTRNNETGRVEKLFEKISDRLDLLKKIGNYYLPRLESHSLPQDVFENIVLPVYILQADEDDSKINDTLREFEGKSEFDLKVMTVGSEKYWPLSYWETILKCIQDGIENDDDVIIICNEGHSFTADYDKNIFIQNIMAAHAGGCDLLLGGVEEAGEAVYVSESRFWINVFKSSPLLVFYKRFFEKVLTEPFEGTEMPEAILSEMATNKILVYPFISISTSPGADTSKYTIAENQLKKISKVCNLYAGKSMAQTASFYKEQV